MDRPATVKRVVDLILVLVTLPLWGPVLAALMLAVLICDGRPIFFPQPRVGRGGRPFMIWKLRSMTCDPVVARRQPTALGRRSGGVPGPAGAARRRSADRGGRGADLTAALDGHYARHWTWTLDLAILLRTGWINLVGKRRGARPLPSGLS